MFTGLIETIGILRSIKIKNNITTLNIDSGSIKNVLINGESIAINGVCLTVTKSGNHWFEVEMMNISGNRSNLRSLKKGDKVNLERALMLNSRLGGHIVTGHVDRAITLLNKKVTPSGFMYYFELPNNYQNYIASRGSVSLNGVSLTVADKDQKSFTVSLIPETLKKTNLGLVKPGEQINLEVDIIARYLNNMLSDINKKSTNKIEQLLHNFNYK